MNDHFPPDRRLSPALGSVLAGLSLALVTLPAAAADAPPHSAPGAVEIGALEMRATGRPVPPSYQHTPVPRYPAEARQQGLEGVVVLNVLVRSDGRVEEARVAASSGAAVLDEVALDAVRKWTFVPATQGGHPVESVIEVPVKFALKAP